MRVVEIDDRRRVAAITAYDAVRMPPKAQLQSVVELAAQIADVPMATINMITDVEQHQVATVGFEPAVCAREDSMCAVTVREGTPVALADASEDARFARNPFVTGELGKVRFYAAHPLVTRDGVAVGTLCVFDERPRTPEPRMLAALATLAERVVDVFELRLRSRELALSLMENQSVQAELERSNERLASFAGQVSHDLKTPITTISLSLSLIREQLQEEGADADTLGLLGRAINGASRMADLLDDVLDFARLGGTLKATEVDLDFVLGEVLDDLGPDLVDATLHIDRLPTVLGDRAQLRAVLQNLLGNAAKYHSDERPLDIHIGARHVQRAWRIEITDNGRGVPPADRHRVFEPLARVDNRIEGSGIGLATCRRIVGAHGGRIGIDPAVVEGSRFWFELPD
ncbi:MAG TPA: GAF domain-containing sensor histidine kinase [Nocardioides sp.]|uniref:sensor histidine kinase n=1 Tax=uncultured Nocardioides sp. TaxID=198441 RepID=UPI002605A7D2|nr:GAF domain-containing sensor histidine kinase [uncultured Nocardioides sp.]HRD60593.1 GAF domain-containing sensor histidine kinase [Nocardioides sp.]HRI95889.1 GAF domain-containing sensor histidine kinase [Nocardioides sp.]HRK45574.1 GAF domain-containing sensor histidine kinase [Nocardioides sp.]